MFVNCQPARRLCLPDLAPAQAIVRAGERRGNGGGTAGRCGIVALARGWPCGSGGALPWFAFGLCVPVAALPSRAVGLAFLSRLCPSRVWHRVSVAALPSRASGFAVLAGRFSSVHACCLPCDKQDGLRYAPFLFRRVEIAIRAFSICRCGYLSLLVHFGFGRFFMAIPTGCRGREGRGTGYRAGGAALVRFCAIALAL